MYEPKITSRAASVCNELISFVLITTSPLLLWLYLVAYQDFEASLSSTIAAILHGKFEFITSRLPFVTGQSIATYSGWVLLQAILYAWLPGPDHLAPRTPGGRRLVYKLNGLRAWLLTVVGFTLVSYYGFIDPAFIAKNWASLWATANFYCFALIAVFFIKARTSPDNKGDTLITGKSNTFMTSPR